MHQSARSGDARRCSASPTASSTSRRWPAGRRPCIGASPPRRPRARLCDSPGLARRPLARHWRERSPQEQSGFVAVFKQLLGRAYIGRLEGYTGEQIVYLGETVDAELATVRSKHVTIRGTESVVHYSSSLAA